MSARGEIWTVAGGVYASKPRPALVIQDDVFLGIGSVTVVPFTTTRLDAPLLRISIPADVDNGLDKDCWAEIDKITTVRATHLSRRLGRLSRTQLSDVERSLAVFLGLAH